MARAAVSGRLTWLTATVRETREETETARTLVLDVPGWPGHLAGQHVTVKLTAADGYSAHRDYSIASAPEAGRLELTVQRLDDGEVSPYLVDDLIPGDPLELRGPIGGYFAWEEAFGGPLLLVAGGSGIVPFRAMLRHWAAGAREVRVRMLYSARSLAGVLYRRELAELALADGLDVQITLTRSCPEGWAGRRGRVDRALLDEVAWPPSTRPLVYVCGPTAFVETVGQALVESGHDPARVRTERFGPTGS